MSTGCGWGVLDARGLLLGLAGRLQLCPLESGGSGCQRIAIRTSRQTPVVSTGCGWGVLDARGLLLGLAGRLQLSTWCGGCVWLGGSGCQRIAIRTSRQTPVVSTGVWRFWMPEDCWGDSSCVHRVWLGGSGCQRILDARGSLLGLAGRLHLCPLESGGSGCQRIAIRTSRQTPVVSTGCGWGVLDARGLLLGLAGRLQLSTWCGGCVWLGGSGCQRIAIRTSRQTPVVSTGGVLDARGSLLGLAGSSSCVHRMWLGGSGCQRVAIRTSRQTPVVSTGCGLLGLAGRLQGAIRTSRQVCVADSSCVHRVWGGSGCQRIAIRTSRQTPVVSTGCGWGVLDARGSLLGLAGRLQLCPQDVASRGFCGWGVLDARGSLLGLAGRLQLCPQGVAGGFWMPEDCY